MEATKLELPDAEVYYVPALLTAVEADTWFAQLLREIQWEQLHAQLFGRRVPMPRLTAWYGAAGKQYFYSGISHQPLPWTDTLLEIKRRVEPLANVEFNSVLLNRYRHGRDSVAWHADDEPELGTHPVIASVSLGHPRRFQLKHKRDSTQRATLELTHGSCLLMQGPTQHHWLHQIPKTKRPVGERINLTYRVIL